jgi:hypothetical protein
MLAAIISFTHPELSVRLALEDVARLDEGFTQAELIVGGAIRKIRVTGGVRGVGFQHDLCLHPRLISGVIGG